MKAWQKCTATPPEIDSWSEDYAFAPNTGVLTKFTPVLDIDILDPEAAEAIEAMARDRFEQGGLVLVRVGLPPKRAIPFQTAKPFKKISRTLIPPNAEALDTRLREQKIDFLADGQQIVVDGIHPDTRKPYRWHGGELGHTTHDELPAIDAEAAQEFVDDVVELLIAKHGYRLKDGAKADRQRTSLRPPAVVMGPRVPTGVVS